MESRPGGCRTSHKGRINIWEVDIINMSFGWEYIDEGVEKAISYARRGYYEHHGENFEKKPVLLFAATSNYGATRPNKRLYPARSEHVISVDSADGYGNAAGGNSGAKDNTGKLRFTALGIDVDCYKPLHLQPDGTPGGTKV
jgi:hypothetical protein